MFDIYDLVLLTIDDDIIASVLGTYYTITDFDLGISRDMDYFKKVVVLLR